LRGLATHRLGFPLALRIFRCTVKWVPRTGTIFREVSERSRLASVQRARTGEQKLPGSVRGRKFEHSFRSAKNGLIHLRRLLLRLLCAVFACRVNHVLEIAVRVSEVPDIAREQNDRWIGGQVGALLRKRGGGTGENDGACVTRQLAIGVSKTFR
jgi:hypothetical protein